MLKEVMCSGENIMVAKYKMFIKMNISRSIYCRVIWILHYVESFWPVKHLKGTSDCGLLLILKYHHTFQEIVWNKNLHLKDGIGTSVIGNMGQTL
jgi:hypothetical protein